MTLTGKAALTKNIAIVSEFYVTADKNGRIELQFVVGNTNLPKMA